MAAATSNMLRITEDDLLKFQVVHFSDDSVPHSWFIDQGAADALISADAHEGIMHTAHEDLGLYPDGVRRTLTNADVAYFRQAELMEIRMQGEHCLQTAAPPAKSSMEGPMQRAIPNPKKRRHGRTRKRNDFQKPDARDRNYTQYVDDEQDNTGYTYRRKAREMDAQTSTALDMDY